MTITDPGKRKRTGQDDETMRADAKHPPEGSYTVKAVARALDIFELLRVHPEGLSLAAISQHTNLPKSSAFRYLATLEQRRYVERQDGDTYRLGLAFLPLRPRELAALGRLDQSELERLRDHFGETINLGFLDGSRVFYQEIVESPKAMRLAARPGDRDPLHSTALGKAIACQLSDEQVKAILGQEGMPKITPKTITDPDKYLAEIATVRKRGYAVDNGENEEGGRCVAVPVPGGPLPAAISLSAPASRLLMEDIEATAEDLRLAGEAMSEAFRRMPTDAL